MILSDIQMKILSTYLPKRFQIRRWEKIHRLAVDGAGLAGLLRKYVVTMGSSIMIIKDTNDNKFGCFATDPWIMQKGYFGAGECFLFSTEFARGFRISRWTKQNDYFQYVCKTSLQIGGGGKGFGIYLDDALHRGTTSACDTFEGHAIGPPDFKIADLEVYCFPQQTPSSSPSMQPKQSPRHFLD